MLPVFLLSILIVALVIGLVVAGSAFIFIATRAVPLAIAVLGGLAVSTLLSGSPATGTTIIAAIALFILLESFRAPLARRRRDRARYDVEVKAAPAVRKPRQPKQAIPAPTRLDAAFDSLAANADWAASRVAVARQSCQLFLDTTALVERAGDAADFAPRVRNGIPDAVDLCLASARVVTAAERRVLLDDCVADIEHVAAEADRIRARLQPALRQQIELQRQYLRHKPPADPFAID